MSVTQELFELADAVSAVLRRARDPEFVSPLQALERACDVAKRACSGSNMGYHANVYYDGVHPPPPGAEFNPEWGLIENWPTHQPDPGWRVMNYGDVIERLLMRAKITDLPALKATMRDVQESLSDLKEQAVSMLNVAISQRADPFIKRQLERIETLKIASASTIAPTLVRPGQWSRDSEAHSQGLKVAPHQSLIAIYLSHRVTTNGLVSLEKAVRLSATHIQQVGRMSAKGQLAGTNVVIGHGHSALWRELKDFVKDRLYLPYDEFNRVQVAGVPNTIRLTQMLDGAAVAFIVLTGDDVQIDGSLRARQNVVHEVGLFQGRLGFTKAILMIEDGCDDFSNVEGLGQIRFPKGNIAAVFEKVREVLEREGILSP